MSERALVSDLPSPHPLGAQLPSILQEPDDPLRPDRPAFVLRFLSALDEQVAPVFSTLDNLHAYLDPWLAPKDFLDWLAGWVGVVFDEAWSMERRRAVLGTAVELYRWRGTRRGFVGEIELATGVTPEIEESGGVAISATAESGMPGTRDPTLLVRLRVADPSVVDQTRLEQLVESSKPAFVAARVEVVTG